MRRLEYLINTKSLESAKPYLVPFIFSQNYYNILMKRIKGKRLSYNERYYYNHFIKKKLLGMIELFEIKETINGKEFIIKKRLSRAITLLKKYSRKHKNMKILISGSFLFRHKYNDIDVFILSKYDKEDYRDKRIHINYLPEIENTLFFKSLYAVCIANFRSDPKIEEEFNINDVLHLYEVVVLLMMQKDDYLQELRDLILRLEYLTSKVILNSAQLKTLVDKIIKSPNPINLINKYFTAKIINSYKRTVLIKALKKFIKKNSSPEKGQKIYKNWKIYNETYKEAIEVVA